MTLLFYCSDYKIYYCTIRCCENSVSLDFHCHCSLQIQNIRYGTQKYKGTFQTMVQIGKEEGIQKLWRCVLFLCFICSGNLTAEIYWFLYTGIQFSSYEAIQSYSNNIVHSSFLAGALSSSFTTLVTYPFDIMRTRFVYQADQKYYTHIASGMYSIGKTEGITGLYRVSMRVRGDE